MIPKSHTKKSAGFLRNVLFGNLTAKIMALVLALALWSYAYTLSLVQQEMTVPLDIKGQEGWSWSLVDSPQRTVSVAVSYPRKLQQDVETAQGQIRVEIDAAPLESGPDRQVQTVRLDKSHLKAPAGFRLSVREFRPDELHIRWTREYSVALRIEPQLTDPPPGYQIESVSVSPTSVRVQGRKDVLSRVSGIQTLPIDISGFRPLRGQETYTSRLPARVVEEVAVDGETCPVKCDTEVQVDFTLRQVPQTRTFKNVPIHVLQPPDYSYVVELREEDRQTDVVVRGPADVVEKMSRENVVLYVSVENLKPGALPYPQEVRWDVVNAARANELSVKPALGTCNVKISERMPG